MSRITLLMLMMVVAAWIGRKTTTTSVPDPQRRMSQLLNNSEDIGGMIQDDWESNIWFTDQPSHMVVDRVHGGITPGHGALPVQ